MDAARVIRGDFCSRYDWDSLQLKFIDSAEQPEEEENPGSLNSHARSPQLLRESSHGGTDHTDDTERLQRGGRRWCASEHEEELILEAASAMKRVDTLSLHLIRECMHCPTAVALGQCLVELNVDIRCQLPVPRDNAVRATTRVLAKLSPLLHASDSVATAVREGLEQWHKCSGASAGPMPASQLHLLIIGAVSWQLERSRGLAESVQRALLHMLVCSLCPLLSATWDWMTRGHLPSHEEFFVMSVQQAARARSPVESWSNSFFLRQGPSRPNASWQTPPECITPPATPSGTYSGSATPLGVPPAHSIGSSDGHGGGRRGGSAGGAHEVPRAAPGVLSAACPAFLEQLSGPILACGRAVLLLRRLHKEKLMAAATAAEVAAMDAAYRKHGLVGSAPPPTHSVSPCAEAVLGTVPSEGASAGAGTGAAAQAGGGVPASAGTGEGGEAGAEVGGGAGGSEGDLLLSFIRALMHFLHPLPAPVRRPGTPPGAAPGIAQSSPESDPVTPAAPASEGGAPAPRTSQALTSGGASLGAPPPAADAFASSACALPECGSGPDKAPPGEPFTGPQDGDSGPGNGRGPEQTTALSGQGPEAAAGLLGQVTEAATAAPEVANARGPRGSRPPHSQDKATEAQSQQPALHDPELRGTSPEASTAEDPGMPAVSLGHQPSGRPADPPPADDSQQGPRGASGEQAGRTRHWRGEYSYLRGAADVDMWGPSLATRALTAAFAVALGRDNFGFAEGNLSSGSTTSSSSSSSSSGSGSSPSWTSSSSPQQGLRDSDAEGECNPNVVCRQWAKKRLSLALAHLGGGRRGMHAVEELERLKTGPLQRLPPLALIFQHCLLPQITAKVAQTQKALVHALMHECHLTRVLRHFVLVFLLQDGAVGEGLCVKLWEGLLRRSTQDWDELHMQLLFEGCMRSSVEFREEPQAVQLLLAPRTLGMGRRSSGTSAGERPGVPSATKTREWAGHPSGHRGSDHDAYAGSQATPGDPSQASTLSSVPESLHPEPVPGVLSFPPLLSPAPPAESPFQSPAPARWSAQSGVKGDRTTRAARAHTAPEDLLLQVISSIRLRHTLASTSWPLQLVLDPQALTSYQQLFTFLSRLTLAKAATEDVYSRTLQVQKRIPVRQRQGSMALVTGMRTVHVLVASLHTHFVNKVVGFHWGKLLRKVEEAASLEEAQSVHRAYLTSLTLHCFLGGAAKGPLDTKAEVFVSTAVEEGIRYSLLQRKALKAAAATASVPTPASATATGPEAEGQQEGVVKKRESTQGASRGALEAEMARLLEKLLSTVDGFRKAREVRGKAAPAHIQELAASIDFGRRLTEARATPGTS